MMRGKNRRNVERMDRKKKANTYSTYFKDQLYKAILEEHPETRPIDNTGVPVKDWKFNKFNQLVYNAIQDEKFQIKGNNVYFTDHDGTIPLKKMPSTQFNPGAMIPQRVLHFKDDGLVIVASKRGKHYPTVIHGSVPEKDIRRAKDAIDHPDYRVYAYVIPDHSFIIAKFSIEHLETEDVQATLGGF